MFNGVQVLYPRYLRPSGKHFHPMSIALMYLGIQRTINMCIQEFKPHLQHAYMATPDGYVGLLVRERFQLPLVVSLLGSDINVYPGWSKVSRKLTKRVLLEADKVIAVSEALKLAAIDLARPMKEIDVVYMGCETERFVHNNEARDEIRRDLAIPTDSPVLIFIGQISEAKGAFDLLKAFRIAKAINPSLHLIFIGNIEDHRSLERKLHEDIPEQDLHFVGAQNPREIPRWLSSADIFVLPSLYEGLPNVVIEAMSCEKPVISTKEGGIPEIVEDGKNGILINGGDIRALSKAISDLVADSQRRKQMAKEGRRVVERNFSWRNSAQSVRHIYEDVLLN